MFFYAVIVGLIYAVFSDNLPDIDTLETFQPKRVTRVWSMDGSHLLDFKEENRELIRDFDEIPQAMKDALVSIEDRRFFSHWGIDLRRIFGAIKANLLALDPTAEGASTLTQQLARNLYQKVGTQRSSDTLEETMDSYARKMREQITAVYIERLYTKREILVMYLNTVFFGHDALGLKSAARLYFDKEVSDLAVEECALIAGLLRAPNYYSPLKSPERAKRRRNLVMENMVRAGKLGAAEARRLSAEPVRVHRGQQAESYGLAPYFVEYVRRQLGERYGKSLYQDGYSVHTTVNAPMQRIAEKHFNAHLDIVQAKVDARLARLDTSALPDSVSTRIQGAFVAMDPSTGEILAMIGGRDVRAEFNRAYQAHRQAGSSFKPFVYAAALDNGHFPSELLDDNAITITEQDGSVWTPENYDRKFKGRLTLREGFKQSRNIIALKLAMDVTEGRVSQYAHLMGINTPIREVPSIGIGSSEVILLEMVAAYSVFPNRGIYVEPTAVHRIEDADGNIIEQASARRREVLRPAVTIVMTDMMRSVMDEAGGTGRSARTVYGFRSPAAGKTGTTNDYRDAWFIGFTPDLVAGVWVGADDPRVSLANQSGATAALPLWALFMKEVYDTLEPYKSRRQVDFEYPEDLVEYRAVCDDTHALATRYCPNQSRDLFIRSNALPATCPLHGASDSASGQRRRRL